MNAAAALLYVGSQSSPTQTHRERIACVLSTGSVQKSTRGLYCLLEGLGFDHAAARIFAHEAHKAVCFWEKLQLELLEDHKY